MWRRASVLFLVVVVALADAAVAQTLCVECREPDRTYRCTVKDGDRVQHVRSIHHAFEFVCISEIARTGDHKSCRVGTAYAGPCIGQPFEVDLSRGNADRVVVGRPPAAGTAAAGAPEGKAEPVAPPPGAPPAAAPAKKPPETLEQLARETMVKSKEQMTAADAKVRQAGDAVGGAVKKTWDCLVSLFARC